MQISAKFTKGEKYYIARVPELGVTTQGRTLKEAKVNLEKALSLHIKAMADYAIKHGSIKIERGHMMKIEE